MYFKNHDVTSTPEDPYLGHMFLKKANWTEEMKVKHRADVVVDTEKPNRL